MIPTSIDGTDITGATIDGTDVTEITVDGQTVFSAAPDLPGSAVAHYDAQELSGFNDSDTVSTWNQEISGGQPDATGGATYRNSGINGFPAIEFDGINQSFSVSVNAFTTVTQPATHFVVFEQTGKFSGTTHIFGDGQGGNGTNHHIANTSDGNWNMYAGSDNQGSTNQNINLITVLFDGSNSIIREDGTQTGSGDAGSGDLLDLSIGKWATDRYFEGYIGELVICDSGLSSSEIQTEEQRLANKWDITI